MSYRYEQEDINSISNLIEKLRRDESQVYTDMGLKPRIWFRGLRDIGNKNINTFFRDKLDIKTEIYRMNLFKQNAHELLATLPSSEWEWMFLMRHHHLPSRLIDWTENPLVGLYFAVRPRKEKKEETDGVIWFMIPSVLNKWAIGWPENDVSLPMFTENPAEYPINDNSTLNLYLPSNMKLLSEGESRPPAAAICVRTNRRIQAQMGVFTIHHADTTPIEEIEDGTHIWRYKIPKENKPDILEDLRRIGITERTVYPDLDNVAIEAMRLSGVKE